MEMLQAKEKFIQTWGILATQWGINRTMAQIHALLFVSPAPLSVEEIMESLQISRGNASMNLRELMHWNIVYKEIKSGERKEYFVAEKNIEKLATQIAIERSKRELSPAIQVLREVSEIEQDGSEETAEFIKQTKMLYSFTSKMNNLLHKVVSNKPLAMVNTFLKYFKK